MSRRNNYNLGPALISFTAIFAVIGMIVQTCAILFGYDANMRVFKLGSKIATVSVAALFILSILTITLAICVGKLGKMRSHARGNGISEAVGAIGGFAMTASSIIFLMNLSGTGALKLFTVILFIISIPAGLSFFLGKTVSDKTSMVLSFFPPLWNAVCLVRLYFDSKNAINDPVRILLQITLVTVMLALTYELKLRVKGTGKIMLTVTASLATVLACSSFTSIALLYFIVRIGGVADVLLSLSSLLISLYLLMRLGAYYKLRERN